MLPPLQSSSRILAPLTKADLLKEPKVPFVLTFLGRWMICWGIKTSCCSCYNKLCWYSFVFVVVFLSWAAAAKTLWFKKRHFFWWFCAIAVLLKTILANARYCWVRLQLHLGMHITRWWVVFFFKIKHKSIFQVVLKVKLVLYGLVVLKACFLGEKIVTFVSKNT